MFDANKDMRNNDRNNKEVIALVAANEVGYASHPSTGYCKKTK